MLTLVLFLPLIVCVRCTENSGSSKDEIKLLMEEVKYLRNEISTLREEEVKYLEYRFLCGNRSGYPNMELRT
jgi:hypothetical protein